MATYWIRTIGSGAYIGDYNTSGSGLTFSGNNPVNIAQSNHNIDTGHDLAIVNTSDAAALANADYGTITVPDANNYTVNFNGTGAGGTCDVRCYKWYTTEAGGTYIAAAPGSSDNFYVSYTATNGRAISEALYGSYSLTNFSTRSTDTGGTDNGSGELDLTTRTYTLSGYFRIAGYDASNKFTLTIGSGGKLITGSDIIIGPNTIVDLQTDSEIENSGDYSNDVTDSFLNSNRGAYTQKLNANFISPYSNNAFYDFTLDAFVVLTFTGGATITTFNSNNTTLGASSRIVAGANSFSFGSNTGTITIGAGFDITGSGIFSMIYQSGCTITDSKVDAYSFTGTVRTNLGSVNNIKMYVADFSNADYEVRNSSAAARTTIPIAGTLKSKKFTITNAFSGGVIVTNSTNNPSYEWSDDVDLNTGAGTYTTTWTKGTGSITLTTGDATTKSINFDNQTIEDLIINSTDDTDIKQLTGAVTTDLLTVTDGIFDIDTQDCTSTGLVSVASGATLKQGVTGSTGLILNTGLSLVNGSSYVGQTTSKIVNNGTLSVTGNGIFNYEADYTQNDDTSTFYTWSSNLFYNFTLKAGKTITSSGRTSLTSWSSNNTTFEAGSSIVAGANAVYIGGDGTVTFASDADISGTGDFKIKIQSTVTWTWNRSTALTFAGTVVAECTENSNAAAAENFANADYYIDSGNGKSVPFKAGTLSCKKFEIKNTNAGTPSAINNNTNNPSFEWSDNVNFKVDESIAWNKGTGTITISGASKTFAADGQNIENVALTGSYTFTDDTLFSDLNCTGTGTFDSTKTYTAEDITGNGTLASQDANIVYITYTGDNTFTGTLTNVVLVGPAQPGGTSGNSGIDEGIRIGL